VKRFDLQWIQTNGPIELLRWPLLVFLGAINKTKGTHEAISRSACQRIVVGTTAKVELLQQALTFH
jgi:hypothetical protein